jgi:hypothetical protein
MRNAELDTLIDERVAEALTAQNLQVIIDQRVAAALAPPPPNRLPCHNSLQGLSASHVSACVYLKATPEPWSMDHVQNVFKAKDAFRKRQAHE